MALRKLPLIFVGLLWRKDIWCLLDRGQIRFGGSLQNSVRRMSNFHPLNAIVGRFFIDDPSVKDAMHYWLTGEAPEAFSWLRHPPPQTPPVAVNQKKPKADAADNRDNKLKTDPFSKPNVSEAPKQKARIIARWIAAIAAAETSNK